MPRCKCSLQRSLGTLGNSMDQDGRERSQLMDIIKDIASNNSELLSFMRQASSNQTNNHASPRAKPQARPGRTPMDPDTRGRQEKMAVRHPEDQARKIAANNPPTVIQKPYQNHQTAGTQDRTEHGTHIPPPQQLPRPPWAAVAAKPSLESVQLALKSSFRTTREKLAASGFAPANAPKRRPDLTALYFGMYQEDQRNPFDLSFYSNIPCLVCPLSACHSLAKE